MTSLTFLFQYKWIILFYLVILVWFIVKRNKFEVRSKIICLYKTKLGINYMRKFVLKHSELVKVFGYVGFGASYVALFYMCFELLRMTYNLLFVPSSISGLGLVLPGANIPGIGVLPFSYWLISLFCIAAIHEFSHGIVAISHGLKIESSGIVLLGPIIGAFVEPDEKELNEASDIKRYSVLAAGSFSNILLGIFSALLFMLVSYLIIGYFVDPVGFSFDVTNLSLPAGKIGLLNGSVITALNGQPIFNYDNFTVLNACVKPNQSVELTVNGTNYSIVPENYPDNPCKPYFGIEGIKNEFKIKDSFKGSVYEYLYFVLVWLQGLFKWLFVLSLGVGLFNLLPIGFLDGGQMMQLSLQRIKGFEKGTKIFGLISLFFILLIIFNLVYPLLI